ncbi:disulfide bond formation protein B [Amorphus sp. 3PC139-8]|uniref:disulfide bond formation protein B n=1 Tax=Amorphus sp. 3PC139-8 TaxID=2735676 RepID=UPI00345CFE66
MTASLARPLNAIGLLAITCVLIAAFVEQILYGELPCPLCLLQRVGFVIVGAGLAMNLLCGLRPGHYGIMLLGAVIGGAIALRQVALHIVPGTGADGDPVLGLHLYTWAFVVFGLVVIGVGLMLLLDGQFSSSGRAHGQLARIAVILFVVVALANGLSTVLECGSGYCPDNPTSYQLLDELTGN